MNFTINVLSNDKTELRITEPSINIGSEWRIRTERDLPSGAVTGRLFPAYKMSGIVTCNIIIEDHSGIFLEPFTTSTTATLRFKFEYGVKRDGNMVWETYETQNYTYPIRETQWTRPDVRLIIDPLNTQDGFFVSGKSSARVYAEGEGKFGANIVEHKVYIQNKEYPEGVNFNFDNSGDFSFVGVVKDTRGFTNQIEQTVQVFHQPLLDSVSCSSTYVDGTITYKFTRPDSDLSSKINLWTRVVIKSKVGTATYVERVEKLGGSVSAPAVVFTLAERNSIYTRYPNTATVPLRFELECYRDSTYTEKVLDTSVKELTLSIPNNSHTRPSISSWTTGPEPMLLNQGLLFVREKNGINLTIKEATGAYGANIVKREWTLEGKTYNSGESSEFFKSSGTIRINMTVTDSRGFQTTKSKDINVQDYMAPMITGVSVYRCNTNGVSDDEGNYLYIGASINYSSLSGANGCKLRYRIKAANGSFGDYKQLISTSGSGTGSYSGKISNLTIDADKVYLVELSAIDSLDSLDKLAKTIASAKVFMDKNGSLNSIAFGGYAQEEDAMEIHFDGYFYGNVVVANDQGILIKGQNGTYYQLMVDSSGSLKVTPSQTFSLRKE
jgi:hypothetical protein